MNKTKETFLTAFTLFSLFFGAGNLILPPFLGYNSDNEWLLTTIGFSLSAVLIPIIGIYAHAKLQGTMIDFAKKISPAFSIAYCSIVYLISISIPSPRTASVTYEMAIAPYFDTSPLTTSIVYFALVFVFVINRSRIIDLVGKFLTPFILIILLSIIGVSLFSESAVGTNPSYKHPFSSGFLEGYQTFDAIAAVVVGAVIIISINTRSSASYSEKRKLISKAGILAGIGLLIIYAGLIYTGAMSASLFGNDPTRSALLNGIAKKTLGNAGNLLLSILVSLACFTTAVGIVTGTSDYVKKLYRNSDNAYYITAALGCVLGILIGQYEVGFIIDVAIPALMFIYPITIVLIILNALPDKYTSNSVFKKVVGITILFSIPDFINALGLYKHISSWSQLIPLSQYQLGWVIPSLTVLIISNCVKKTAD